MPIKHLELKGSRSGTDSTDKSSTAELIWSVWGSTDHDACRDYLADEGVVPLFYDDLVFKSLSWEHQGADKWEFRAAYVHPEVKDQQQDLDTGDYTFSFDTGSGTVKRTVSLGTTPYKLAADSGPEDFKGAIGVVGDEPNRTVEGVDIGIPALKFSIRMRFPRLNLTLSYVIGLMRMTYTTNSSAFLGFAAGELLFIGASGQEGKDSDPEITFNFIASPNATALTIGAITGVAKKGHEYLWVRFEPDDDATAKSTVRRPKACYVEKVYDESNFNALGIV